MSGTQKPVRIREEIDAEMRGHWPVVWAWMHGDTYLGHELVTQLREALAFYGSTALAVPNPKCPDADQHTPRPTGYLNWNEWAADMAKTHRQQKCPGCGLWLIWKPKARLAA